MDGPRGPRFNFFSDMRRTTIAALGRPQAAVEAPRPCVTIAPRYSYVRVKWLRIVHRRRHRPQSQDGFCLYTTKRYRWTLFLDHNFKQSDRISILFENLNFVSARMVATSNMLRSKLPPELLTLIQDYVGPCAIQKARKDAMLSIFNTGKIGIPTWTVFIHGNWFEYAFVIPNNDDFEYRVCGSKRKLDRRGRKEQYATEGYTTSYEKYFFYITHEERPALLRKQLFAPCGTGYVVGGEGGDTLGFHLTYDAIHNFDVLYILKYTRGPTPEDVMKSIQTRFELLSRLTSEDTTYHGRIVRCMAKELALAPPPPEPEPAQIPLWLRWLRQRFV